MNDVTKMHAFEKFFFNIAKGFAFCVFYMQTVYKQCLKFFATPKKVEKQVKPEPVCAVQHQIVFIGDRDDRLFVSLYKGSIKRSLRLNFGSDINGNRVEKFKALPELTMAMANQQNMPFSLEGAIDYTCQELGKKLKIVQEPVAKPSASSKPVDESISTDKSQLTPTLKSVSSAEGNVLSAERIVVEPEGKTPYETFQVMLKSKTGVSSFTGKDLEEKFAKRTFHVGDLVRIERKKSSNFNIQKNGQKSSFSKNEFDVHVIQSSQLVA